MSLTGSPGASLNPSRQAARNHARSATAGPVRAGTALVGSAAAESIRIGQWTIQQDEHGNLVGSLPGGTPTPLLTADPEEQQQ